MLKHEMNVYIDHFFHEGSLDEVDEWDVNTRTLPKSITITTTNMLAGMEDLIATDGMEEAGDVKI